MNPWDEHQEAIKRRLRQTGLWDPVSQHEITQALYGDHPRWDLIMPSPADVDDYKGWVYGLQLDAMRSM
jgi:hypothetical protein